MKRLMASRVIESGVVIMVLALGLAACSSGGAEVIHVEDGADETAQAQTAAALQAATPSEPTSTPLPEGTPYVIPTTPPDIDDALVITRVGNEEITLGEFRKRVRFERWYPLYQLAALVEKNGPAQVLDLTLEENMSTASLFVTLADSNSFGRQVHRLMVIDAITMEEARRRDLEVDPNQFNARLAGYLGMVVGEGGALPPEFDAAYADFLAKMTAYTGLTEEEFRRFARARTLYSQLKQLIGHEPGAVPSTAQGQIGIEVQDILVETPEIAQSVITRLGKGESMRDIALSLGLAPTGDSVTRVLRRSDPNVPDDVLTAVYAAEPGAIVGPMLTAQGWYVAVVGNQVFDVMTPEDVEAAREDYFLDWVEGQMDDPEYVEDYGNWFDSIPQEPLPRDVSPYFQEEYMVLPVYVDPVTGESVDPYAEFYTTEEPEATSKPE